MGVSDEVLKLFERDLEKLIAELEQYQSEASLWSTAAGVSNAAGNLVLHINGNLNHYIGATLGGTGYHRDREAEFATRDIPKATLIAEVSETKAVLSGVLGKLGAAQLEQTYPVESLGYTMSTRYFLIHLYGHLSYHLGQVNYLRRVLHG